MIDLGADMRGGLGTQVPKHPFHITRDGKLASAPGIVADLKNRNFYRRVRGHGDPQLRIDAVLVMLEYAVPEPVPAGIRLRGTAGQGRGRPEMPGLFIP